MGDQQGTEFQITIPDAFGFRSMIEFVVHSGFRDVVFGATPDRVYIREKNGETKIDIDIQIDLQRVDWYYSSDQKKYEVSINIRDLAAELSNATVKTSLVISKEPSDKLIIFSLYGTSVSGEATNSFMITPIERSVLQQKWDLKETDDQYRNVFMTALDFGTMTKGYKERSKNRSQKTLLVHITGYENGLSLSSQPQNSEARTSFRGEVNKDEKILSYAVPQDLIRSFSEIHKFNKQNGIVSFFFEEGKPIKIVLPVSNFALIRLYVDNYQESS